MKKNQLILFAVLMLSAQFTGFSQSVKYKTSVAFPLVADGGISDIIVTDDIDLVLIQEMPGKVVVKASDEVTSKLAVSFVDGKLYLARAKGTSKNERLTVYAWIDDLENLTLSGTATATSIGVLQTHNLHVSASEEAGVSLKSKDKVWFDTPTGYQVNTDRRNFYQYSYSSKD